MVIHFCTMFTFNYLTYTSKVSKMIICKFNILGFKRGDEQGSQKQCPRSSIFENLSFCLAYENGQNKAKIHRPDFHAQVYWKIEDFV